MTHHAERRNQIAPPAAAPAMSRSTIRATATSGKPPPVGLAGVAAELAAGVSVGDGPLEALDDGEGVSVGDGDGVGDLAGVGVGVDGGGLSGRLTGVDVAVGVGGDGTGDADSDGFGIIWNARPVAVVAWAAVTTLRWAKNPTESAAHATSAAAEARIQHRPRSRGMWSSLDGQPDAAELQV
jgi:hypothetical protein